MSPYCVKSVLLSKDAFGVYNPNPEAEAGNSKSKASLGYIGHCVSKKRTRASEMAQQVKALPPT